MDKKASTQAVPVKQPGIVRFFASVWSYLTGLVKDFVEGDVWVKLSALLWGSSCVARKQYLKGILLTVVEALFAYLIPVVFWPYMSKLNTLGTVQQQRVYNPETRKNEFNDYDNSFLILLFGVIGCVLLLGLPIMVAEFSVGRASHRNAVGAYRALDPKWTASARSSTARCCLCRCWAWCALPLFL